MQAIKGAKSQGATKVIGIDKNPRKEAKGRAFGMTDFINPDESDKSIAELVKDLTKGMGVDYSFECTGVPALINQAIEATKLVFISQFFRYFLIYIYIYMIEKNHLFHKLYSSSNSNFSN